MSGWNINDISSFQGHKSMQAPLIGNLLIEVNTPLSSKTVYPLKTSAVRLANAGFTKPLYSCDGLFSHENDIVGEIAPNTGQNSRD